MAFCNKCGKEILEGKTVCEACGAENVTAEKKDGQRKVSFDGEVHKCPNCGEVLNGFESVCSACGFEIRGVQASASLQEFVAQLADLEKEKGGSAWLAHQAFGENQLSPVEEKKVALIKNYPIPNTKEDLREFMILAATNLDKGLYVSCSKLAKKSLTAAWRMKLEQAYQKAKWSFGGGAAFVGVQKIYIDKIVKPKRKKAFLIGLAVAVPVIVVAAVLVATLL